MRLAAGRAIGLGRRLDRGLLLARLDSRQRVLEATDRRAESAPRLRQSLGAEHDQRDNEDQEQVAGAEDVLDHHAWSPSGSGLSADRTCAAVRPQARSAIAR